MNRLVAFSCTMLFMSALCLVSLAQTGPGCEQSVSSGNLAVDQYSQDQIATVARCYVQNVDNLQASRWYERIADMEDCKPQYLFEYGQCLKSLKLYGKAKFYFQKYAQHDPVVGNQMVQGCDIARMMLDGQPMFELTGMPSNSAAADYAPGWISGNMVFSSWPVGASAPKLSMWDTKSKAVQTYNGSMQSEATTHVRFSGNGKYVTWDSNPFSSNVRLIPDRIGAKIYIAEVSNGGKWGEAKEVLGGSRTYAVAYPTLSDDGNALYFASNMPGGQGGWDIYMIQRNGTTWSSPQNLGGNINTPGDEICPFVSGDALYFSSDWHIGIGGFDVFTAARSGGAFDNVRNVGFPVSSPKDDIDFIWDPVNQRGVFASNRIGGSGSYDLYQAKPLFTEVEVTVLDRETMNPVSHASLTSAGNSMVYTNDAGIAIINRAQNGQPQVRVRKEGYNDNSVDVKGGQGSAKLQIYLEPVSKPVDAVATTEVQKPTTPKEVPVETKPVQSVPKEKEVVIAQPSVPEPRAVNRTPETRPVNNRQMYFIQIAALARNASLDQYSNLRMYGDLVVHDNGTFAKVRLGTFETESEAKLVLSRVRGAGYPDAFVVTHADEGSSAPAKTSAISDEYKVRLATYSKVGNFNPDLVTHLGSIESYRKDDLTIMLLSGYSSLNAAQQARDAAVLKGFTDAYVVMDKGGVLERVK